MIIDSHVHIGNGPAITSTPAQLIATMDEAGVDKAIVIATRLNSCGTAETVARTKQWRDRLAVIGVVSNPHLPGEQFEDESLEAIDGFLKSGAIRGLKFNLGYQHYFPHDPSLRPYFELLEHYGRPAIFHTGNCYTKHAGQKVKYAHPLHLDQVAADNPKLQIVMAHCGNPWIVDAKEVCYSRANVVADCSGFICGAFNAASRERFLACMKEFLHYVETPEKLLFGSDWPISDMLSYTRTIRRFAYDPWCITNSRGMNLIMHENAERVFGLKKEQCAVKK